MWISCVFQLHHSKIKTLALTFDCWTGVKCLIQMQHQDVVWCNQHKYGERDPFAGTGVYKYILPFVQVCVFLLNLFSSHAHSMQISVFSKTDEG